MRIISQNGMVDLPYEDIGISINHHNKKDIIAYPACNYGSDTEFWTIALYSTEAKAQKAMEMLRNSYNNFDWIKTIGFSDELKTVCKLLTKEDFKSVTSPYFQFPKDEDVEVDHET